MMGDEHLGRGVRAGVRRLLRFPLRTERGAHAEADAELEAFLRDRIEHFTTRGMTADEARAEALRRLGGDLDATRIALRRSAARRDQHLRVGDAIADAWAQLGRAGRSLAHTPGFGAATVGTVALAVGAACTLFAVMNPILLRPLPYPNADRLVGLWYTMPGLGLSTVKQSLATYVIDREYAKTLEAVGVYVSLASTLSYERSDAPPERARVTYATPSVFTVLGARPIIGRLFTDSDTGRGAPVIISEALWRTRFGADPDVVGRTLGVDGAPHQVIGVMPSSFAFPQATTPAWIAQGSAHVQYAGSFGWDGIGRLRPAVTIAQAQRELQSLLGRLPQRFPEAKAGVSTAVALQQSRLAAVVHSMRNDTIGGVDHVLWLIAGIVALLVVVALSNIASLMLVHVEARRRELAVRAALGASQRAVLASATGEAALAAAIGGAIGFGMTILAVRWLIHTQPLELPRLNEVRVDGAVIGVAAMLTLAFVAIAALIGAFNIHSGDAAFVLRDGGRTGTASRQSQRFRSAFVGLEVALSLVLLAGSGVLVRSALNLRAVQPGFDPSNLFTFWTFVPDSRYRSAADVAGFYRRLLEQIRRVPGVESDAVTGKLPLEIEGFPYQSLIWADDGSSPSQIPPTFQSASVTPDYFSTMRIPIITGRSFDDANVRRGAYEAVASRGFVARVWHDSTGRSGVGKRLRPDLDGPWFTIVGVVNDVRDSTLTMPPISEVYFDQEPVHDGAAGAPNTTGRNMGIVVRTRGSVPGLEQRLERELHALDPNLPFYRPATMRQIMRDRRAQLTTALMVFTAGAVATLALGVIGLYGVIAYVVGLRTRELSIRIALGLSPARAPTLVLREGYTIILSGAAAGVLVFLWFARLLRSVTFEIRPADLPTLAVAIACVVAISFVAMWLPARRAARLNPAAALKTDG